MAPTVARTTRDVLTVSGPEAVTWLQGQLSQDLDRLAPGDTAWTFILAPQGKVDGWGRVQRTGDDSVQIDVDPGAGQHWVTRLERFKLRTKADVALTESVPMIALRGGTAEAGLPAGWPGTSGVDYLDGDDTLVEALVADGAIEIDHTDFEAIRVRAGVPHWDAEVDGDTIPATLGQWVIDASVSFTKGCFTGQELVARIDSRGGNVPRRLVVMVVDGPPPAVGAEVLVDGKAAGTVTSSAPDRATGGSVALLFAPRSIEVPATADIAGRRGGLAEVPLPAAPLPD